MAATNRIGMDQHQLQRVVIEDIKKLYTPKMTNLLLKRSEMVPAARLTSTPGIVDGSKGNSADWNNVMQLSFNG